MEIRIIIRWLGDDCAKIYNKQMNKHGGRYCSAEKGTTIFFGFLVARENFRNVGTPVVFLRFRPCGLSKVKLRGLARGGITIFSVIPTSNCNFFQCLGIMETRTEQAEHSKTRASKYLNNRILKINLDYVLGLTR